MHHYNLVEDEGAGPLHWRQLFLRPLATATHASLAWYSAQVAYPPRRQETLYCLRHGPLAGGAEFHQWHEQQRDAEVALVPESELPQRDGGV